MMVLRYIRHEVARITVRRETEDELTLDLVIGGHRSRRRYSVDSGPGQLDDTDRDAVHAADGRTHRDPDHVTFPVVVLDVRAPVADGFDWERWAELELDWRRPLVRESSVRPRVLDIPLTYPLRVLEVRPASSVRSAAEPLGDVMHAVFGASYDDAIVVGTCATTELLEFRRRSGWPTAEVLHSHHLPELAPEELFDLAASWQTRLIVFEASDSQRIAALGAELVALGGPAVLLWPWSERRSLYAGIVHDQPLDFIAHEAFNRRLGRMGRIVLFAGERREDLLRVSKIVQTLNSPELREALDEAVSEAHQVGGADRSFEFEALPSVVHKPDFMKGFLARHASVLGALAFGHETQGTIPSAAVVRDLKESFRAAKPQAEARSLKVAAPPVRRHVNACLHHAGADIDARAALDPKRGFVEPGKLVHLAIQIGPRALELRTLGLTTFVEEAVLYGRDTEDTQLEVGVTAPDFELLGSAVQRIRLPRTGESEIATFSLLPRDKTWIPGVARLRICLYHHNALIQSFRLAVALKSPGSSSPAPDALSDTFARALDLTPDRAQALGHVEGGYVTRLEYAAFDMERPADIAPRRVSFFVNDSAGEGVVTVKGQRLFSVAQSANLATFVKNARDTLGQVSFETGADGKRTNRYRFYADNQLNHGSEAAYASALCRLAADGWQLYSALVKDKADRARFEQALAEPGQVIHAGHLNLNSVVPWGVLYTRYFDSSRAAQAPPIACTALLEDPSAACGKHPACPLHEANVKARQALGEPVPLEKTTACPRHFLGFRHIIEVPVQQAHSAPEGTPEQTPPPAPMQREIRYADKLGMLVGYNAKLGLAKSHLEALDKLKQRIPQCISTQFCARNDVVDALENELDIVYFYCHALEAFVDPASGQAMTSHLVIENSSNLTGRITPGDIAPISFKHQPLVFMNGCSTVGFSPYAPAEFITQLRESGASVVIGTEATVWEALAVDMAVAFLENFLAGKQTVGQALLAARLGLLQKKNPLGLAYTLYGPADLALVQAPGSGP